MGVGRGNEGGRNMNGLIHKLEEERERLGKVIKANPHTPLAMEAMDAQRMVNADLVYEIRRERESLGLPPIPPISIGCKPVDVVITRA